MPRKTAEELLDFIKGEENLMGTQSKATVGSDEDDIKTGDKVTNMALHYANKGNKYHVGKAGLKIGSQETIKELELQLSPD